MIGLTRWPKLEDLRAKLSQRAKAKPDFRFYSLHDKVYRTDVLEAAYAQVRSNGGAPGVDGQTFEDIEKAGVEHYLAELARDLKEKRYQPQPVRRVRIPKEGKPGEYRPLGIPVIRDRIAQQAVRLLLEPIFEADFTDEMYGYRAGRSAQDAVQAVLNSLWSDRTEVVDADLSKYFDTIPHAALMKSVQRRIADSKVLWLIRAWLKVPVQETTARGKIVISGGRNTKQGTPQGGVISPLLANIYFRRLLKAWEKWGWHERYAARIINYADDFVILTKKRGREALEATQRVLKGLGLTLNTTKTRIVRAWEEPFTFLGYTFGKRYAYGGKPYLGGRPSDRNVKKYRQRVHQITQNDQTWRDEHGVLKDLNACTRGFWGYFNQGVTGNLRGQLDAYLYQRLARWVWRKSGRTGYRQHITRLSEHLVLGRTLTRSSRTALAACP